MKNTAGQLMIPIEEFPTIFQEESLDKAIITLTQAFKNRDATWRGFEVLFVTDYSDKIIGFITVPTILAAIKQKAGTLQDFIKLLYNTQFRKEIMVNEILQSLENRSVALEETIETVASMAIDQNLDFMLVYDQNSFVGVVRVIDLYLVMENILFGL